MELLPLRARRRGFRQIGKGLGSLDREVFEAIAESPTPMLDATMPRVSRAADHSKLWLAIAAALAALGGPSARRGATRGVLTLAATSLFTNQLAKRVWRRARPDWLVVPLARRGRRFPTSNSLPSGHSASAAAFAVGVGLESSPLGLALALLQDVIGQSGAVDEDPLLNQRWRDRTRHVVAERHTLMERPPDPERSREVAYVGPFSLRAV